VAPGRHGRRSRSCRFLQYKWRRACQGKAKRTGDIITIEKRIVIVDFETYFDRRLKYDLKNVSITEYIRDSRFWPLGLAYRFLDEEKTHWLAGNHPIEAWVGAVDWANTVVIAHNAKFDGAILAWRYSVKPSSWIDTVAMAKATLGENVSGYSLKRLAEYLGLPAKGEMACEGVLKPTPQQLEALGVYCKNDVDLCKGIYEKLMPSFPKGQLSILDWTVRCFIEPKLVLDIQILTKGVEDEKRRREEIIKKSGVDKATLSSNKQFAEYLRNVGVEPPTKLSSRTGKPIPAFARTDRGLAELATSHPDLYAARIASKSNLLETRGESLLGVAKTGLFPFDVGFSGAVQTHRYSGGSGAGGNPQNFTRNSFLRGAVCAPAGYSLIVGDFAAIELRLLAWLAKEPRLIGKILADEDIYCDFASLKYGRKITKADKIERQFGKCCILGLGYNMGAKKFRATVKNQTGMDISEADAWKTVDLYRTTYFNVPKLWEQAHSLLPLISAGKIGCIWYAYFIKVKQNALVLPSGLEIKYPNLRQVGDDWVYDVYHKVYEAETTNLYGGKIIENICQALAGELCKEAIARAEGAGLKCVGQVHDEIIAIAPSEKAEEAAEILKRCMEQSPSWLPTLRLKAEVGIGQNWGSAKA
jgi:DNA polymerase